MIWGNPQLPAKLLQGGNGILGKEKNAKAVVNIGCVGEASDKFLGGLPGLGHLSCRHVILRQTSLGHQRFLIRRKFRGKVGEGQSADPHGGEDRGTLALVASQSVQKQKRCFRLSKPAQEQGHVIAAYDAELGLGRHPEGLRFLEPLERTFVIFKLEFAQTEHGPSNASLGLQGDQLCNGVSRFEVPILLIQ